MKNSKKLAAMLLCLVMVLAMFAGCGKTDDTPAPTPTPEQTAEPTPTPEATPEVEKNNTLVYATSTFGQKFSPFFATTAYDQELVDLTQGGLLAADRGGNIIRNGIEGETVEYNGTDYTYYGMGNVDVVMNDDGSVDYNLTMRDDIVFSDGTPADIDDVIFGIYVLADPTYDGASTLYALPIEGIEEYYNAMTALGDLLIAAGRDNTDYTYWDEATQTAFWAEIDAAGVEFAQSIIDYVMGSYCTDDYVKAYMDPNLTAEQVKADEALQVKYGMYMWGYDGDWFEGATAEDYWKAIEAAYPDVATASDVEAASVSLFDLVDGYNDKYGKGISTGDDVTSISGVIRTGDYSLTIHCTSYSATTIYNMSFTIAPLHYYGDESLYDYENNSFGFTKGDLSSVRAKTTEPMGCGPYMFKSYSNGVVTLEANPYYFLGEPATKYILMQEANDPDYIPGVSSGAFDVAVPSISADAVAALQDANSNGDLTGDVITTILVDYRGYGYLGINADLVNVGGVENAGSDESKNLRKAFMTLFSVYRDTVINSYYGDRASVIQYPISNTSWAAPRPTDEGYQNCYSVDVDGNPLYTDDMTEEQKYEKAFEAAIGFLKAAGYTYDEAAGKFTAAPEGASMTYEVMIPGQGVQDHPAYGVAVAASEQLAKVGITLQVNDVGTAVWNNALEENTAEMWAAAWQATADPDMYQVYYSANAHGLGTNSNHYSVDDPELDELILAGRGSADNDFRKATYKEAMEVILDWGVELPLYQRKDCTVASTIRVDCDTLPKDMTPYLGWYGEIETLAVK